ncbi:unnamed protein product [Trichogramma brassicae]|uniref:Uncharacterized protein n=1 Tax=Trichogramma brassicae TaxID=86971 RepID=A0A6H5IM26_9HYME|nr:unnamed protein product [Trichogramma brassicae]
MYFHKYHNGGCYHCTPYRRGDGFQRLIEKLSLEDDDDDDDVAGEGESSVRERKDEEDHPIPSANHLVAKESDDDESESKDDDSNCPVASGSSGPGLRPDGKPWASEEEKREYYQNTISQIESSADENDDDQWEDIEDEDDQDMAQYIKDSLKYYGLLGRNENDLEEVTRLKELSDSYNSSEEAKQDAEIIKMVIQAIYSIDSVLDKFPLPKALILDKKAKIMRKKSRRVLSSDEPRRRWRMSKRRERKFGSRLVEAIVCGESVCALRPILVARCRGGAGRGTDQTPFPHVSPAVGTVSRTAEAAGDDQLGAPSGQLLGSQTLAALHEFGVQHFFSDCERGEKTKTRRRARTSAGTRICNYKI